MYQYEVLDYLPLKKVGRYSNSEQITCSSAVIFESQK